MNKCLLYVFLIIFPACSMDLINQSIEDFFSEQLQTADLLYYPMHNGKNFQSFLELIENVPLLKPLDEGEQQISEDALSQNAVEKSQAIAQIINSLVPTDEQNQSPSLDQLNSQSLDQEDPNKSKKIITTQYTTTIEGSIIRIKKTKPKIDLDPDYQPSNKKRKSNKINLKKKASQALNKRQINSKPLDKEAALLLLKELIKNTNSPDDQIKKFSCYEQNCELKKKSHRGHSSYDSLKFHVTHNAQKQKTATPYSCPCCSQKKPSIYPSLIIAHIKQKHPDSFEKMRS